MTRRGRRDEDKDDKRRTKTVPELIWTTVRLYKPKPFTTLRELIARIDRRYLALFGGAALALATLVPISFATSSGIAGYKAFKFNTNKHKETPLTNHMGLRTVVTYSPSEAGRSLQNSRREDPWGKWKRAKVATFQRRLPLYLLFAAGFVGHVVRGAAHDRAVDRVRDGLDDDRRRRRADLLLLLVPVRDDLPVQQTEGGRAPSCSA